MVVQKSKHQGVQPDPDARYKISRLTHEANGLVSICWEMVSMAMYLATNAGDGKIAGLLQEKLQDMAYKSYKTSTDISLLGPTDEDTVHALQEQKVMDLIKAQRSSEAAANKDNMSMESFDLYRKMLLIEDHLDHIVRGFKEHTERNQGSSMKSAQKSLSKMGIELETMVEYIGKDTGYDQD